jgi:hypothetical protein
MPDYKTGRLSVSEQESIKKMVGSKSIAEIADLLRRRPQTIKNFAKKMPALEAEENIHDIERTPIWRDLQRQLEDEELLLFREEYIRYIEQFKNDVLYTETVQICDAIKLGILGNRCLAETKTLNGAMRKLDEEISRITEENDGHLTPEAMDIEQQRMALLANFETQSKEYQNFMNLKDKAFKALKVTRDQRYAKVESARTSFVNWMQNILEDSEHNVRVGKYIEKNRLAMEKEGRRLSQPYQYEDGDYDIPFLNADTVNQDYEELNEGAFDDDIDEDIATR